MLNYNTLKSVVESAIFVEYEEISYEGLDILLFPCEHTEREEDEGIAAIFYTQSCLADWDIYISTNVIPEEFLRSCLVHEIAEIYFFSKYKTDQRTPLALQQSHKKACSVDNRYAKETLSKELYSAYNQFRSEIRK